MRAMMRAMRAMMRLQYDVKYSGSDASILWYRAHNPSLVIFGLLASSKLQMMWVIHVL